MTTAPRSSLLAAKLRALVAGHWDDAPEASLEFPGGAALVGDDRAWLLLDGDPLKGFGPALVWAARHGASEVHLLADARTDILARRAACFTPMPTVWQVEGTSIQRAPAAPPPSATVAPSAPDLAELLVDADLEVVIEDGIVRGEVKGLEVARIVHGVTSTGIPIDEPQLEVGVGHADRELTAMLHGGMPPLDQLARVSEIVRAQRHTSAERHPLNQMAPERWLRAALVAHPERLGLVRLAPLAPAVARPNLKDTAVAMAVGETADGETVVVACSIGVDLDLVPAAADARLTVAEDARLLLVVPRRDAHPVTTDLAARLTYPAELVTVDDDWRD